MNETDACIHKDDSRDDKNSKSKIQYVVKFDTFKNYHIQNVSSAH
jgi:hypothetical protein